tara:strand:- start:237 stop:425 length:189 start_codon:yes stop_codon:yes gene_type:complete
MPETTSFSLSVCFKSCKYFFDSSAISTSASIKKIISFLAFSKPIFLAFEALVLPTGASTIEI